MNIDLSITISVILALSAILSPIIVAIINNRHQRKMKQLEMANEHKIRAIEEYMSKLVEYITRPSSHVRKEYGYSFGQALLYVSSSNRKLMIEIDNLVKDYCKMENIADKIETLAQKLQRELEKYKCK